MNRANERFKAENPRNFGDWKMHQPRIILNKKFCTYQKKKEELLSTRNTCAKMLVCVCICIYKLIVCAPYKDKKKKGKIKKKNHFFMDQIECYSFVYKLLN